MDIGVRLEGGKTFGWFGIFLPCCKASVPLRRSGSWSVGSPLLFPPVSSLVHSSPGKIQFLQNKSSFQPFLPSNTSDSNTALILVTCVKQTTPSFLLMWYWQYKLNTIPFPRFVVGFIWRVQNVFLHAVIQAKSQLVKLHHSDSGWTYKENTILISGLGQTDKLSDFMHNFC